ncbi:MAG TPA: Hsp70 family protein [Burkholderiales bacterium]|nr:Hsp70 family protein [Burkholderiales bacterium]
MPKIKVLPHASLCPQGGEIEAEPGKSICDALLENHIDIEHAREDMHARALAEHRVEGQRLIDATRSAMQTDSRLLSPSELELIKERIAALEKLLPTTDHRAIKQAADALNRATEDFAGRRMDEGIKRALAGRKISSL